MKLPRDLEWTGGHVWPIAFRELEEAVSRTLRAISSRRGLRTEMTSSDLASIVESLNIALSNPRIGLVLDVGLERISNEWSRLSLAPPYPERNDEPLLGSVEEQDTACAELEDIAASLYRRLLAENPKLMEHELGQVLLGWLNRGVYGNEGQGGRLHALDVTEWTLKVSKDRLALLIPRMNDALASPDGCPGFGLWPVPQKERLLCSIAATRAYEPVGVLEALDLDTGTHCLLRAGLEPTPRDDESSGPQPQPHHLLSWLDTWLRAHSLVRDEAVGQEPVESIQDGGGSLVDALDQRGDQAQVEPTSIEDMASSASQKIVDVGSDRFIVEHLWLGYTDPEIQVQLTGGPERTPVVKTITNRMSMLRTMYGRSVVPTRAGLREIRWGMRRR